MDISSEIDDLSPIYLVDITYHKRLSRPSGSQRIGVNRVTSNRMNASPYLFLLGLASISIPNRHYVGIIKF
jgi:hypothetical protein